MSSSSSSLPYSPSRSQTSKHSTVRRARRRRTYRSSNNNNNNNSAVPTEIRNATVKNHDTSSYTLQNQTKNATTDLSQPNTSTTSTTSTTWSVAPLPRVELVPGHWLFSSPLYTTTTSTNTSTTAHSNTDLDCTEPPWLYPNEPAEPPPVPNTATRMVRVLLLGPAHVGKTTLLQRFLHRTTTTTTTTTTKQESNPPQQQEAALTWSVAYHKKDVTFWNTASSPTTTRVQFWDVTGLTHNVQENTRTLLRHTTTRQQQQQQQKQDEWQRLLDRANGIFLVLSLEHGTQQLLHDILQWKHWLDYQLRQDQTLSSSLPEVVLLVHKTDLLPSSNEPQQQQQQQQAVMWVQLGAHLQRLCQQVGIAKWHLTTCVDKQNTNNHASCRYDASVDDAIMTLVRDSLAKSAHTTTPRLHRPRRSKSSLTHTASVKRSSKNDEEQAAKNSTIVHATVVPVQH